VKNVNAGVLHAVKSGQQDRATELAIPIISSSEESSKLVPIGSWIFSRQDLIESMASWRERSMRFFLAQFEASASLMTSYLEKYAVGDPNRILFLIFVEGRPLGHIGLANVTSGEAEVDNMIRGAPGGSSSLMADSELALLNWAVDEMGIGSFQLRIQSRNFLAKRIHAQLGFRVTESLTLRRTQLNGMEFLEPCDASQATETFSLEVMQLESGEIRGRGGIEIF